jgi:hypothetical protein
VYNMVQTMHVNITGCLDSLEVKIMHSAADMMAAAACHANFDDSVEIGKRQS